MSQVIVGKFHGHRHQLLSGLPALAEPSGVGHVVDQVKGKDVESAHGELLPVLDGLVAVPLGLHLPNGVRVGVEVNPKPR